MIKSLASARHTRSGVSGMSISVTPALLERIENGVHHGRRRGDRSRLSTALDAERILVGRHAVRRQREGGHVVGARQAIVHEGAGEQLPRLLVVDAVLVHGLAQPLCHAAVHLPVDQHGIDDAAEVVDGGIVDDVHRPGLGIDLDLADVTAVGEGAVDGFRPAVGVEPRLHALRQIGGVSRLRRQFHDVDGAVGAGDGEVAVGEADVRRRDFEQIGGDLRALVDHLGCAVFDRQRHHVGGARAAGAAAGRQVVAVSLDEVDGLEGNPQALSEELGIGGFVPLAGRTRAGTESDATIGAEADGDMLGRVAHGRFDVDRHADTAQPAPRRRFRTPFGESRPAGKGHTVIEVAGVVARVIGEVERHLIRHLRRRDQVAPADLVGRKAEFGRGLVDQAFDHIIRFRDPGAAVGIREDGVGEHPLDLGMDRGRAVGVREHARVEQGGRDGAQIGDVGAEIGERPHAEAQELPVGIQRQRRPGQMVACLGVAEKALGAAAQPAHRQPQLARRPGHQDLLVIGEVLHAEAAAEVVREDAQAVLFDPENAGDDGARAVHVLAVDVEGVALARRDRRRRAHRAARWYSRPGGC